MGLFELWIVLSNIVWWFFDWDINYLKYFWVFDLLWFFVVLIVNVGGVIIGYFWSMVMYCELCKVCCVVLDGLVCVG